MVAKKAAPVKLYSDASVFSNGRPDQDAYYCVVLDDGTHDGTLLMDVPIGDASVNEAEYRGVIAALQWYYDQDIDEKAVIITDSMLVYGHVVVGWSCTVPILRHYRDRARALIDATGAKLMWHSRKKNKAGWHYERVNKQRHKTKAKAKSERKRSKRKIVRSITLESRKTNNDNLHEVWDSMKVSSA